MFINEEIIATIFKLINFLCVITVGFYLFKKYVAPDIETTITKQVAAQKALQDQQITLENRQCELDATLKEQLLLCEQLKNTIDKWKNFVAIESAVAEKQHTAYKAVIEKKIAQRAVQKEHDRVQGVVINQLIPQLEESLSHFFNKENNNTHYLNSIVHFMNKRV